MVPGKEGLFPWGPAVLGDTSGWPKLRINSIKGKGSSGELEDRRDTRTGTDGELPRRSVRRGKTLAFDCTLFARNLPELRDTESLLGAAFDDTAEQTLVASYKAGHENFGVEWGARARCSDFSDDDDQTAKITAVPSVYQRDFTVSFRLSTGLWVRQDTARTASILLSSGTGVSSRGTYLPNYLPAKILPPTVAIDVAAPGTGVIVNQAAGLPVAATMPADPTVELWGPAVGPQIENLTVGVGLYFPDLTLDAGDRLTLNFAERSILLSGVGDARDYLERASDWWRAGTPGLAVGENVLAYSASGGIGDAAHAEVSWADTLRA